MKKLRLLIFLLLAGSITIYAQQPVDSIRFFRDEGLIDLTLATDIRKLQNEKGSEVYQDAELICRFPDSTKINEGIKVAARGHFRRDNCTIPPLLLNFRKPGSPLNKLGKLKLVIGCGTSSDDEQLILKEYLVYKIYNLLEDKSFRVRLVRVNYRDTRNKVKPFSQYAFLIEDDADMAKRNNCKKMEARQVPTESTNRALMTKVAVFQYMISNGDWSVPNNHNIRLIYPTSGVTLACAVPYDFDHSGFVNAGYAMPNEILGTESVKERVYRGFPRTMEELQLAFDLFKKQHTNINTLIKNFPLLKERSKKELVDYIEEFYDTINDRKKVQYIFIDNARTK